MTLQRWCSTVGDTSRISIIIGSTASEGDAAVSENGKWLVAVVEVGVFAKYGGVLAGVAVGKESDLISVSAAGGYGA